MSGVRLVAALWLAANGAAFAQNTALPLVSPASIRQGVSTSVIVRAEVRAPMLVPGSVNVQKVNAAGQASVIGLLNDNGVAGDTKAGDRIYGGQVMLNVAAEGALGIRVSYALRGVLRRVVSPAAALAVVPADAPTGLVATSQSAIEVDPQTGAEISGDMVNACFTGGTSYASVKAITALVGGLPVGSLPEIGNCFQIQLAAPGAAAVAAAVATLAARPEVRFAEPDFVITAQDACPPTNLACGDLNYTDVLGMPAAHNLGEGQGVMIGILDTGLDASLLAGTPGLPGVVIGSNFVTPGTPPADDSPVLHGTTVAVIAQAAAPQSTLFIAKVLPGAGKGRETAVIGGMKEAALAGATVVNVSMRSTTQSQWMLSALNIFQSVGIHIIAAAGNDSTNSRRWPAAHIGVIAVGNTDSSDLRNATSNFGNWVNVSAPGVGLFGNPGLTGTSLSAPWVAGTVALMLGKFGPMSIDDARKQLFRTALPIPVNATQDTCPALPCNQDLGAGRIDPSAALGAIRLTRSTAVGASGSFIPRMIDVSIRNAAGTVTIYPTTMTFLGQANQCQVKTKVNPPCIQTIPFDFAALPPGGYQLRLSFAAQAASYFGTAQLMAPGAVFTSVARGTGGINAADATKAEFSLFGAGTSRTTIFNIFKP